MARPCLLDCDPGHDDAVALLVAAGNPRLDLRAITTVAGNGPLEAVTDNARRVCELAGIEVPVAAGATGPLARTLETAPHVHGERALMGPALPEPRGTLDRRPADRVIADVAAELGGELAIIATGPLTNVALALERHPGLAGDVREIVLMGGSTGRGDQTPYAEFNVYVDPEAAARVFSSGLRVTMVGLDVTHQAIATPDVIARIRATATKLGDVVAEWLTLYGASYKQVWGFAAPVHDACAVALAIDPSLFRCVEAFVAIETVGRWTRGATVVDLHGRLDQEPNARVALELDVGRFWELVVDAIAALGES
jgi:purine nucleosidase